MATDVGSTGQLLRCKADDRSEGIKKYKKQKMKEVSLLAFSCSDIPPLPRCPLYLLPGGVLHPLKKMVRKLKK